MDDVPKIPQENQPVSPQASTQPLPEVKHDLNEVVKTEAPKPDSLISYSKKRGFIDYFIILVSVIAFLVWVAVGALYLQNRGGSNKEREKENEVSPTVTQTPTIKYNISTKNGNVININNDGVEEIILNKEDFKLTGISGFIKVSVSPDQKKLCFESWPPSPEPSIYVSDIDGKNAMKVNANRKSCLWSGDSRLIAYNDVKSQKEGTDLYTFDPTTSAETLLTVHTATESASPKLHTATGWSSDNKKLLCQYSFVKTPGVISECEVDLDTKVVFYK